LSLSFVHPNLYACVADTASLIAQLEETAAEAGGGDLGKRGARDSQRQRTEAALRAEEAEKRARFEAAVEKSNWASQALRQTGKAAAPEVRAPFTCLSNHVPSTRAASICWVANSPQAVHRPAREAGVGMWQIVSAFTQT
jgi:hypothetical protein